MNVISILKDKGTDIITTDPEARLLDVVTLLNDHKIGSVLVIDDNGTLVGIISERDIIKRLSREGADALYKSVGTCMTSRVQACRKEDSLDDVMTVMTQNRFRHLPVVDGLRLLGLISIGDVVKLKLAETQMETTALRQYIATG